MTNHTTLLRQSLDALLMAQVDVQGALYSGVKASRIAAAVKALQEELAQPAPAVPADPWKSAVLDRLAILCMDAPIGEAPASILNRVIETEVMIALDPAVSEAAQALIDKGAAAPAVREPLTDEQIDVLWDRFNEAPTIGYRYFVTKAIERAHGITGDSK